MNAVKNCFNALLIAGLMLAAQQASAVSITSGFTGAWFDPELEGQGFDFTLLREQVGTGRRLRMLAYWYTFDEFGNQAWALGDGIVENDTVTIEMNRVVGATFPDFDPNAISVEPFATVTFTFDTCNTGIADFELVGSSTGGSASKEQVGTGRLNLARITQVAASQCTGGISDNVPNDVAITAFEVFLNDTGAQPGSSGEAEFEERVDRVEFKVEIEDVAPGDYQLMVDDQMRGTITADALGRGEIEFRSPVEPGKILLDFDPRGALLDVVAGGNVVLTSSLPNDGDSVPPAGSPPPFGNAVTEVDLTPGPIAAGGSGDAELEQRSDRVEFDVEIEDVPPGAYELYVGNELRASILVMTTPSGPEGEVEFRFPVEAGKEPLIFDPRGQIISVRQGAAEYFSALFPSEPNAGDGGGGDADDGDGDDDGGGDDGDDDNGGGGDDGGGSGGDDIEIRVDLINAGVDADASGDARYREDADDKDFRVEVEDLDDGSYELVIGGQQRGVLQVVGGEGELEYGDPAEAGELPLDFDPRGQLIEVRSGATVFLSVSFPAQ